MLESELQRSVIELARILGWRVAHFRPARTSRGWRTPVEADGAGFPDLILVRGGRLLVVESKGERGKLSPAQSLWQAAFRDAGAEVAVWRPGEWWAGLVEQTLR